MANDRAQLESALDELLRQGISKQDALKILRKRLDLPAFQPPQQKRPDKFPAVPQDVDTALRQGAAAAGIPYELALGIAFTENEGFDRNIQSTAGAVGIMQLLPGTFAENGGGDILDINDNISAGLNYFSSLYQQFNQDADLALAAYNAGPGNVGKRLRNGMSKAEVIKDLELNDYVDKIRSRTNTYLAAAQRGTTIPTLPVADTIAPESDAIRLQETGGPTPELTKEREQVTQEEQAIRTDTPPPPPGGRLTTGTPGQFSNIINPFVTATREFDSFLGDTALARVAAKQKENPNSNPFSNFLAAAKQWWIDVTPEVEVTINKNQIKGILNDVFVKSFRPPTPSRIRQAFAGPTGDPITDTPEEPIRSIFGFGASPSDVDHAAIGFSFNRKGTPLRLAERWVRGFVDLSSKIEAKVAPIIADAARGKEGAAGIIESLLPAGIGRTPIGSRITDSLVNQFDVRVPDIIADTFGDLAGFAVRPDYLLATLATGMIWNLPRTFTMGDAAVKSLLIRSGPMGTISAVTDRMLVTGMRGAYFGTGLGIVDAIDASNRGEDAGKAFNETLFTIIMFDMMLVGPIGAAADKIKLNKFQKSKVFQEATKRPILTDQLEKLSVEALTTPGQVSKEIQALIAGLHKVQVRDTENKIYQGLLKAFNTTNRSREDVRNAAAAWLGRLAEIESMAPGSISAIESTNRALGRIIEDMQGILKIRASAATRLAESSKTAGQTVTRAASRGTSDSTVVTLPRVARGVQDLSEDELRRFAQEKRPSIRSPETARNLLTSLSPAEKKKLIRRANQSRVGKLQRTLAAAADNASVIITEPGGAETVFTPSVARLINMTRQLRRGKRPGAEITAGDVRKTLIKEMNAELKKQGSANVVREPAPGVPLSNKAGTTENLPKGTKSDVGTTVGKTDAAEVAVVAPTAFETRFGEDVAAQLVEKDTVLFHPREGNLAGKDRFVVGAMPHKEHIIEGRASGEDITAYMKRNKALLDTSNFSVGGWYDKKNDVTHLSIDMATHDLALARKIAHINGERAIYDLLHGREVPTPTAQATKNRLAARKSNKARQDAILTVIEASKSKPLATRVERYLREPGAERLDPGNAKLRIGVEDPTDIRRRNAGPDFVPRSYVYLDGATPEARVVAKAPFRYVGDINTNRLYDLGNDVEGLIAESIAANGGVYDATIMERFVRDAGYSGYHNSKDGTKIAALFDVLPIRELTRDQDAVLQGILAPKPVAVKATSKAVVGSKESRTRIVGLESAGAGSTSLKPGEIGGRFRTSPVDIADADLVIEQIARGTARPISKGKKLDNSAMDRIGEVLTLHEQGLITGTDRQKLVARAAQARSQATFTDDMMLTIIDAHLTNGRITPRSAQTLQDAISSGKIKTVKQLMTGIKRRPGNLAAMRDIAGNKVRFANMAPNIKNALLDKIVRAESRADVIEVLGDVQLIRFPNELVTGKPGFTQAAIDKKRQALLNSLASGRPGVRSVKIRRTKEAKRKDQIKEFKTARREALEDEGALLFPDDLGDTTFNPNTMSIKELVQLIAGAERNLKLAQKRKNIHPSVTRLVAAISRFKSILRERQKKEGRIR